VGEAFKQWAKPAARGADDGSDSTPGWAQRLQRRQHVERGISTVAQAVRSGERGGSGANPSLRDEE
jgi:type IV secretion system protein TrbL